MCVWKLRGKPQLQWIMIITSLFKFGFSDKPMSSKSQSTWVAPRIHRASRELHTLVCWGWPAATVWFGGGWKLGKPTNSVGLASFPQISDNSIICCPRKAPNTIKYSWISMATLPSLHCSHYVPRCCFRLTYHDNKQPVSVKTDLSSCARLHLVQMQNMVDRLLLSNTTSCKCAESVSLQSVRRQSGFKETQGSTSARNWDNAKCKQRLWYDGWMHSGTTIMIPTICV